ncbi:hypothetical protein QR680_013045 [Steinernema hermaphroditum]|uniref:3-dehydrosphinganine reductase n=1 Tax=Steinernema hermaphroditum TaxID=289476 RepID=A0AA39M0X8_9BILA|nr:hypothetical protein QR680_013045 [Steinernema hermaphroditum]
MPNRPQSGQGALSTEPKQNKLTVKVCVILFSFLSALAREFESIPNRFGIEEFRVLIEEALKTILGLGAPICTVDSFEDNSLKGSIIFESTNLHTVWAALSIYGFHFGRNVAIHLNKIALELIRKGCSVSIAARNVSDLESTAKELKTLCDSRGEGQKVQWYSFDVTESYEKTESVIREAEKELGPVGVLINNAGFSTQEAFHDLPLSAFENQMKVNYLSGVYASRAVFSSMKSLGGGHIGFVSSAAGQCAIWGYTAYSPAKFAVRGFAEALHMEMLPFNIGVSVLFPPNTATEGFQVELDTMPEQVKLISDSAGLFEPDYVAKTFVSDIEAGEFATTIGLDGWMLGNLTVGAAPEKNLLRAIQQVLFAGVFRGVMLGYIGYFNRMVRRCHKP